MRPVRLSMVMAAVLFGVCAHAQSAAQSIRGIGSLRRCDASAEEGRRHHRPIRLRQRQRCPRPAGLAAQGTEELPSYGSTIRRRGTPRHNRAARSKSTRRAVLSFRAWWSCRRVAPSTFSTVTDCWLATTGPGSFSRG